MDSPVSAIAHTIQLSVAPVFLLMGIGTFLNVLSARLSRIVDRARALENQSPSTQELDFLRKRRVLVNYAITFGTFSALLVCLPIAIAFTGSIFASDVSKVIAALFIGAMISFIGLLLTFLAEIRVALQAITVR